MYEERANRVDTLIGSTGRWRRRSVLCAVLLLPALAATLFASPSVAQDGSTEESEIVLRAGQGYYEVYEDGSLNIGGDVLGSCDTVLESVLEGPLEPSRENYRQVRICEEAGFRVPGSESLPETGGPPPPVLAAALLILGGALYSYGVRR